ncbi:sodium/calcium exchanger protein, partial [Hamiltosporidium magnivora]
MNTEKIYNTLPSPSNYIFLLFWIPFLLYMSYLIADDYLIEVLSAISKKYEINSDMAGILLLNIGNGIPDLITSVVALKVDPYIALCISLGSFVFLMTVVLGGVVMFCRRNEKICYRTFYKNVFFTFIAFVFILYIIAMQKIDIKVCIGMLVSYIVFLLYSFYNSRYASDVIEEINVPQVNLQRKKIKYLFDRFSRPFKFFLDIILLNTLPKPNYTPIIPKYILGFFSPMINFFLLLILMNLKMNLARFISIMALSCLSGLILGFLINKSP